MKTLRPLACLLATLAFAVSAFAQAAENLLPEGDMVGEIGPVPRGWQAPHDNWLAKNNASIALTKDDNEPGNLVTITNPNKGVVVRLQSQIDIDPSWVGRKLVIQARLRGTDIQPGTESWHLGGVLSYYSRADGKFSYAPGRLQLELPSPKWRRLTTRWTVPADAKILHLDIGMMGVTGTIQIRDLSITLE